MEKIKLIGSAPNQVSRNKDLGSMAFQNKEAIRVDDLVVDGNVGIDTTSPAEKLHVVGNIIATGNVTAYYSDERLKDFHGNIDSALDKVNQIGGYYFTENEKAKELGYTNNSMQVGVNAQEIRKIMPEVVKPAPIDNQYLTVQYEKLVPLLIEAIKELNAKIDKLEG